MISCVVYDHPQSCGSRCSLTQDLREGMLHNPPLYSLRGTRITVIMARQYFYRTILGRVAGIVLLATASRLFWSLNAMHRIL